MIIVPKGVLVLIAQMCLDKKYKHILGLPWLTIVKPKCYFCGVSHGRNLIARDYFPDLDTHTYKSDMRNSCQARCRRGIH